MTFNDVLCSKFFPDIKKVQNAANSDAAMQIKKHRI